MVFNHYGQIATECWAAIPAHFPHIELDEFVVMPNHMHGILIINDLSPNVGAQHAAPSSAQYSPQPSSTPKNTIPPLKARSLSAAIRSYKSAVTHQINKLYHASGERFWQRNYHDHIIRDEKGLNYLRAYVINNPASWSEDIFHTNRS